MNFQIAATQVWWPVDITVPADDGEFQTVTVKLRFERRSEADWQALHDRYPAADDSPLAQLLARNANLFAEVVSDWNLTTLDGNPVPFTLEALRAVVGGPDGLALSRGIYSAIDELRFGGRAKNLPTSPVPGPA